MAIVHSALGTNLAIARASPSGVLVKTSTGHVDRSQTDGIFVGSKNSRFSRTVGSLHYGDFSPVLRQPEGQAFGGKSSLIQAVNNWQSGAISPLSPCQSGS